MATAPWPDSEGSWVGGEEGGDRGFFLAAAPDKSFNKPPAFLSFFSTLGARTPWVGACEGPGDGGCMGLPGSPFRRTADTLGGVRQDSGEERGRRGREAGEERGEGPRLGPGDTMERGRPDWPGHRDGEEL